VPLAWFVARVSGAKAWLHIQDFEVDAAFALGILSFKWMQAFISLIEKWLMSRFDRVSSISEKMVERLAEKGLAREKLVLFPNWANIEEMKFDRKKAAKFRSNIGFKENDFIILYSGNMGKKQGLEIVLEAAERLKDYKEIRFVLCGEGAVKPELQAKALKMGLSNTVFLPLQSEDNFPGLLFAADLHLIIQKASAADIVFPSKLANILSAGGVALVTTEPDTALGQLKAKFPDIFFTIPPEDVDALVKAIVDIYFQMRKEKCIKLPYAAAREFAEKFLSKEMILSSFGEHLMTLFSTTPGI
jgi:colanic acid biosynthesis glycosyl transferase WcaI